MSKVAAVSFFLLLMVACAAPDRDEVGGPLPEAGDPLSEAGDPLPEAGDPSPDEVDAPQQAPLGVSTVLYSSGYEHGMWGIDVGDDAVFVTTASGPNGRVVRIPLDGSPASSVADGLSMPSAVLADGADVYVVTSDALVRAAADGSRAPDVLAPAEDAGYAGITGDATHVYWTNYANAGSVMRLTKATGEVVTFATGDEYPSGIVLARGTAYWSSLTDNLIASASLDGASAGTFATDQAGPRLGLTATQDALFWVTEGDFPMRLRAAAFDSPVITEVGSLSQEETSWPTSLAVVGDYAYFVQLVGVGTEQITCGIGRLPIAGGEVESVVAFDPSVGCPLFFKESGGSLFVACGGGLVRVDLP